MSKKGLLDEKTKEIQQRIIKEIKDACDKLPKEQKVNFIWDIKGTADDLLADHLVIGVKDMLGSFGVDLDD